MNDDTTDKLPDSFLRAPQVGQDFNPVQTTAGEGGITQDFGSQQVEETENAPRPIPPPSLDLAGASDAHDQASSRDNARVRDDAKLADKAAYLARMASARARSADRSISREWGRE